MNLFLICIGVKETRLLTLLLLFILTRTRIGPDFFIICFSFENKKSSNNLSPGTKLCNALQDMGTTFIKLGQFLATRPDIIGEDTAKELEKLQDK